MIGTKTERATRGRTLVLSFLAAALMATMLLTAKPAYAATFTVNSTADIGDNNPGDGSCFTGRFIQVGPRFARECTLRAAIQETNANDNNATAVVDAINFNIPGAGPHTISPATILPQITEPLVMDGYTQPGAEENTKAVGDDADLRIRLNRGSANAPSGLWIAADDSVVRGLSITGFSSGAGLVLSEDNITVEGNFIGTDPGGTQQGLGNFVGVSVQGGTSDNIVGGTSPGARNIISGNIGWGLRITTNPGETGNKVQGNYIGTTKSGTGNLGNTSSSVWASEGNNNAIGGNNGAARNTIAFNGEDGVEISAADITGDSILGNSIFSNAGLGIDLGPNGVTPNDGPGDADAGANNLRNFPFLNSAKTGRRATTVKGTLKSTQNGTFAIRFFSNPKGTRDEGKKFTGQKTVTDTVGDGIMPFTFEPPNKVQAGLFVTATATNDATDDTSEFSAPRLVTKP